MGSATKAARTRLGAISLSIASHLPVTLASYCITPVILPPGRGRLATKPEPIGSATPANTIGIVLLSRCSAVTISVAVCEDRVWLEGDQLFCDHLRLSAGRCKAIVEAHIATFGPSTLFKPLPESFEAGLCFRIVLGEAYQHADVPHPVGLLSARRERPRQLLRREG